MGAIYGSHLWVKVSATACPYNRVAIWGYEKSGIPGDGDAAVIRG